MTDNGIKRICVCSSDLDKSLSFFTNEMGLKNMCSGSFGKKEVKALYGLENSEAKYAMLKNNEQPTLLQLLTFTNAPAKPIREGRPSWDYGYYDIAFRAKDNSAEYDHFTAAGFAFYCPPTRYVADWINLDVLEAVLKGPDQMPMALIERLKEPIPKFPGRFSIFTDCAITVENGDVSDRFYTEVLGMKKIFDQMLPDGLVDDIVGVPHGTHTRMLMYSGGNTPITECLEYSLKGRSMCDVASPGNVGIFAVAYETDDLTQLLRTADKNGFKTAREPVELTMAPYGEVKQATIYGPGNILVEVFQKKERG